MSTVKGRTAPVKNRIDKQWPESRNETETLFGTENKKQKTKAISDRTGRRRQWQHAALSMVSLKW